MADVQTLSRVMDSGGQEVGGLIEWRHERLRVASIDGRFEVDLPGTWVCSVLPGVIELDRTLEELPFDLRRSVSTAKHAAQRQRLALIARGEKTKASQTR